MRLVRLPFSPQHRRLPQLFKRDKHPRRVDERNLEEIAVADMIPIERDALDQHDRDDMQVAGVCPAAVFADRSRGRRVLPHRQAYRVIETHREPLTQLDDPFRTEGIVTVHRERHVEVRVTQVDVRADLLETRCRPEDP